MNILYNVQHYLKSGGTKLHFRQVKVPGTIPYCKAWTTTNHFLNIIPKLPLMECVALIFHIVLYISKL
jgi:hypothetical protein